jgi:hypothetical protein
MGYVSAKVLSEMIDIDGVIEEARDTWEKRQRKRRSLEKWIVRLLPVGLVIMTAIFYGLSAPHTAALLSLITPGFGTVAPLGFELGVLTLAALREAGWRSMTNTVMLLILLALSIVINIAGAFIAVVSLATSTSLSTDTLAGLLARFDTLPATIQVVLMLIAPVGATIPVMAKLTGEAVMKLALGKVTLETQSNDEQWGHERSMVVNSALYQAAIKAGAGSKTAGNWATSVVENIYRDDVQQGSARAVSNQRVGIRELVKRPVGFLTNSANGANLANVPNSNQDSSQVQNDSNPMNSPSGYTKRMDAKSVTRTYFQKHPENLDMKLDDLVIDINRVMGIKVGRTSVHDVRQEIKQNNTLAQ